MAAIRRPTPRLSARKIQNLKALARKIDAQESVAISAAGRAAFAHHSKLRSLVDALRARRLSAGISLAEAARKSGIAKPNLSRLENSKQATPTLDTLERYARAIGMTIQIGLTRAKAA